MTNFYFSFKRLFGTNMINANPILANLIGGCSTCKKKLMAKMISLFQILN